MQSGFSCVCFDGTHAGSLEKQNATFYCESIVCFNGLHAGSPANHMNKSKLVSAAEVRASIVSTTIKKRTLYKVCNPFSSHL